MYDWVSLPSPALAGADRPAVCHDPSAAVPDCIILPRQTERSWGVPPHQSPWQHRCPLCGSSVSERVPEGRKCQRNVFSSSSAAHEPRFLSAGSAVVMQADMNSLMFSMLAFINVHRLNFPCRRENGKKEGRRSFCRSMRNIQGNEDLAAALRCRMFQTAWWCQQQTSSQSLGAFNKNKTKKKRGQNLNRVTSKPCRGSVGSRYSV